MRNPQNAKGAWLQIVVKENQDIVMQQLMQAFQIFQQGSVQEAFNICLDLQNKNPNHPEVYNLLGIISHHVGNNEKAIEMYQKAIKIEPEKAEYYSNLGAAQNQLEDFVEALSSYSKSIKLEPQNNTTRFNQAITQRMLGQIEEALSNYQKIIDSYKNVSEVKKGMSFNEMVNSFTPELAKAVYNRGLLKLRLGDYEQGFKDHELRWLQPGAQAIFKGFENIKMWDGRNLGDGSLLIYAEQGMGDVLQFVRYIDEISKRVGKIFLKCHPPLHSLLSRLPKVELVAPNTIPEHFDTFAPVMSLSFICDSTVDNIPNEPFLKSQPELVKKWKKEINDGFNVGFVWGGSLDHMNEKNRSCRLKDFSSLFDLEEISFYSLQVGRNTAELKKICEQKTNLKDLGSLVSDFDDTAAIIDNLDIIILVDTSVAHLAGALGKKTWIILPYVPDWRWLKDKNYTPWYPTMKLFRQETPGNWEDVFKRVKKELIKQNP
jgi:Flp pilus assembly protein TadD